MGTWGTAILADDFARDVYDDYFELHGAGRPHDTIRRELEQKHADGITDADLSTLFWLALAKAQWQCGALDDDVRARVERIVMTGEGLDRWREAGEALLAKRRQVLARFLKQLRTAKAKLRKRRPLRKDAAIYEPGTCLAFRLPNGEWGAAIVLAADNTHKAAGKNWVAVLDWKGPELPTSEAFERRNWLTQVFRQSPLDTDARPEPAAAWCMAQSHRKEAHGLRVVGKTSVRPTDPAPVRRLAPWSFPRFTVIARYNIPW